MLLATYEIQLLNVSTFKKQLKNQVYHVVVFVYNVIMRYIAHYLVRCYE